MIRTYRNRDTERLAARQRVRKWSPELSKAALRKLRMLDTSEELTDLRVPPDNRLAKGISVPPRRINEIVHGKQAVTADTALRLSHYFETTPRFWLNLQAQYDLDVEADRLGDRLDREVTAQAS